MRLYISLSRVFTNFGLIPSFPWTIVKVNDRILQHFQIAAVLHFDFMFNESLSRNEIKKKAVIAKGYGSNLEITFSLT